jgi:hypothetical protein
MEHLFVTGISASEAAWRSTCRCPDPRIRFVENSDDRFVGNAHNDIAAPKAPAHPDADVVRTFGPNDGYLSITHSYRESPACALNPKFS